MKNNNSQIQSAIADIAIIKRTIQKSKISLGKFASLFLCFGITQLAIQLIIFLGRTIFIKNDISMAISPLYSLRYLTLVILFVFFIRMRNETKKTENIYTMQLFDMWGIIFFAIPLFRVILHILLFIIFRNLPAIAYNGLFSLVVIGIIEYVAVMIGIFITGHLIDSRALKISAVIFLAVYPILFIFKAADVDFNSALSIYGFLANKNAVAEIIELIAYTLLGVYFKLQNGGEKHGNQ